VTARWRELQTERLNEAVEVFGSVDGVLGIVVAGGVGRGEAWPMSDIDLVPIVRGRSDALEAIERLQARLVDWWAASGRAQTLDIGWLAFTCDEVTRAVAMEPRDAAGLLGQPRWLHGLDKVYGGHGRADHDGLAQAFAAWATAIRFDPLVRKVRAREALIGVRECQRLASEALERRDPVEATLQLRSGARDMRLVYIERWSARLGSLGREWTQFERLAEQHGEPGLAANLADLAGASVEDAARRAAQAPAWLMERIDLAYQARLIVDEEVSEAQSRRDQVAAFSHLVPRRALARGGDWLGLPDPNVKRKLDELDRIVAAADSRDSRRPPADLNG
jgi:predicted nucleotidyltransferase